MGCGAAVCAVRRAAWAILREVILPVRILQLSTLLPLRLLLLLLLLLPLLLPLLLFVFLSASSIPFYRMLSQVARQRPRVPNTCTGSSDPAGLLCPVTRKLRLEARNPEAFIPKYPKLKMPKPNSKAETPEQTKTILNPKPAEARPYQPWLRSSSARHWAGSSSGSCFASRPFATCKAMFGLGRGVHAMRVLRSFAPSSRNFELAAQYLRCGK